MGTFDRYENFKINELGYFRELMKMSEFEKMTSESMLYVQRSIGTAPGIAGPHLD